MSNFAYVNNGVIEERYDVLPRSWRNVSGLYLLEGNETELNNLGWYTIQKVNVSFDGSTQFIADYTYEFTNNMVYETPVIQLKPAGPDPVTEWRNSLRITPFQAKVVLYQSGLLDTVNTMMSAPEADPLAKLAWENAIEFKRLDANIVALGAAIGLTEEQIDQMFVTGATIGVG